MMRSARTLSSSLFALSVAACASQRVEPPVPSHRGETSYHVLADQPMTHYPLALGTTATGGVPLQHPAPVYPAALLARCPPPVQLRALLIVGTDGKVSEVRVDAAAGIDPAFVAAVRAAALQWRFEPLRFNRWAADVDGNSHPVESVSKPFSLPYAFRFACRDGQPQTGSSAAAMPP